MVRISKNTLGKAFNATVLSTGLSVLISSTVVPILGGSYDGIGMWLSFVCPLTIAFPLSTWQFHQGEKLRLARDELASLHVELNRMHSELMLTHAALLDRSRHDAMTGGLNRTTFLTELEAASRQGVAGTLLLADADNFKRINDTFGHQTGDEALCAIAAAISAAVGGHGFWGRIGGEEFAIFLGGRDHGAAFAIAEDIRSRAEASSIRRELDPVPISVSIGGVDVSPNFITMQAMSEADRRLYRAKRGGRNRVVLDQGTAEDDTAVA